MFGDKFFAFPCSTLCVFARPINYLCIYFGVMYLHCRSLCIIRNCVLLKLERKRERDVKQVGYEILTTR